MPFDDDDDPSLTSTSARPNTAGGAPEDAEDALEDETQQDFRLFAQSLRGNKTKATSRTLRRGEKDFEEHGTRAQQGALESSREAMHEVLSYTRTHKPSGYIRGWYFPDRWADVPSTEEDGNSEEGAMKDKRTAPGMFTRDRVVALDLEAGLPLFRSMGRVVAGLEKETPGWGKTWLLPEEALLLVERGSLDLWWPVRGLEEIFPPQQPSGETNPRGGSKSSAGKVADDGEPDYDLGIPLSLHGAYSLFIGNDGERGKISLEKYQVYANLQRTGYTVLRATSTSLSQSPSSTPTNQSSSPKALWQWLISLVTPNSPETPTSTPRNHPAYGPLVKPGLYRSYKSVFAELSLIPRHEPRPETRSYGTPQEPFKIHFHVWKSTPGFTKSRPPPPDFRIAVVDARGSSVPTLQQLTALLESTPWDPPPQDNNGLDPAKPPNANIGQMYRRLKHGWRNAIVAVVDRGLISYLRFGEMAFSQERLFERFDGGARGGGKGKRGGRPGRGGRGRGRGGRGRGG
ncbi:hypothetical protein DL766_003170 [Monosporascus sp. MC13-8B]|uniref:tRNA-splicing endonuclease subunit Sen54 N-terminal domain-containing protein n=1 Tax=Monosporascus cannonballus TaxID=155416 RepID=A0ABY0HAQ2_9PEZI|nr:hypothetical protein DL762_003559 [Monosporascus cannonballus]RYO98164.1 hypothetical protein DL763_002405 [Monosporascus cannonballus]RYP34077.1 hypothetical protein DL766_003170 [Monosporascus sp. MC13-8B]